MLLRRARERSHDDDPLLTQALARAEMVTIGLRMADVEAGDRVVVVRQAREAGGKAEAEEPMVSPETLDWSREDTALDDVVRYVARGVIPRAGTERIYLVGDRAAVFVSPVESHSVERVLRRGPDAERGRPVARGLLSLDYRTGALSPPHVTAIPSLAALVAGIARMAAVVDVVGDRLELDGRIRCTSPAAARKVHRFLTTIVEATRDRPSYDELLTGLKLEVVDQTVQLRWQVPPALIRALILASAPPPAPAPPTDERPPLPLPAPEPPLPPAPAPSTFSPDP